MLNFLRSLPTLPPLPFLLQTQPPSHQTPSLLIYILLPTITFWTITTLLHILGANRRYLTAASPSYSKLFASQLTLDCLQLFSILIFRVSPIAPYLDPIKSDSLRYNRLHFTNIILGIISIDLLEYIIHRLYHSSTFLYKNVHSKHHHVSPAVTPFGSYYNSHAELLITGLGLSVTLLGILRLSIKEVGVVSSFCTILTILDHTPSWFIAYAGYYFGWVSFDAAKSKGAFDPTDIEETTKGSVKYAYKNIKSPHEIHHTVFSKCNYSQPLGSLIWGGWDYVFSTRFEDVYLSDDKGSERKSESRPSGAASMLAFVKTVVEVVVDYMIYFGLWFTASYSTQRSYSPDFTFSSSESDSSNHDNDDLIDSIELTYEIETKVEIIKNSTKSDGRFYEDGDECCFKVITKSKSYDADEDGEESESEIESDCEELGSEEDDLRVKKRK